MSTNYDSLLSKFSELGTRLETMSDNLLPPKNLSKSRSTIQHEMESKIRDQVATLKSLRAEHAKLEKEVKAKQDSVTQYKKSLEQLENRIVRTKEKFEEKVKHEQQRKALITSVFNFLELVGFDFEVIELESDSPDCYTGTFRISYSQIDPANPDKVYNLTFKSSSNGIQILECDIDGLENELKKVEEHCNKDLKPNQINFISMLVRVRKLIMNRLQSS